MRVLLVSIGSLGDTLPSIAWAKELESRGHEVILGVNGYYRSLLEREDVRYESLWSREEHLDMLESSQLWQKSTSLDAHKVFFSAVLPRVYDFILRNDVAGETVVAAQTVLAGARIAQETHAIPLASLHLQPLFLRSIHDATGPVEHWPLWLRRGLDRFVDMGIDQWIGKPLNEFRRSVGLRPVRRAMKSWCNSPDLVINFFPDWFNPPQPDWPPNTHCVGFPFFRNQKVEFDQAAVEAFLSAGEPPIVFSVSSFTTDARGYFEASITAAKALGKRAVFLTPYSEQIPSPLPPTIRYFDFIPLEVLLPRAAIHVHHCGSGTVALTFDAGIPHISVPQGSDQTDIAARLERLRVSRTISPKKYTAESVVKACRELLDSSEVKTRCRELAEKSHRQDALREASILLEKLLERHGTKMTRPAHAAN